MSVLSIIIAMIIAGAVVYLADLLPIDATFKTIIKVVAIVAVVIWLLKAFAPALAL